MAGGGSFGEVVAAAKAQLAVCDTPEAGCFASDPAAYAELMSRHVDPGYERTLQTMAAAATEAGREGRPLEEAMFTTWKLVPNEEARRAEEVRLAKRGLSGINPGNPQKIVDGPQRRVLDALPGQPAPGDRSVRIVSCAYACGKASLRGACPALMGASD